MNGKCICIDGYEFIDGKCRKVPPTCKVNERYDSSLKACVCEEGYNRINGECKKIILCGEYQYWNGVRCECESGYVMLEDGTCCPTKTPDPVCQYNSYFDGTKCVCNTGFFEL